MTTADPLLQPYRLKHLTLRNRVMSTSHEPAYSEDGMPKARYRLYHAEKARGGFLYTDMFDTTMIYVATRETTYHRGARPVTLKAGARLVVPRDDPTVDRGELFDLVREGRLLPMGPIWRVAAVLWEQD